MSATSYPPPLPLSFCVSPRERFCDSCWATFHLFVSDKPGADRLAVDHHSWATYCRFQLRGDLFFFLSAVSFKRVDRSERNLGDKWLQPVTYSFMIYLLLYQKVRISGSCHWPIMLKIAAWRNKPPLRIWTLQFEGSILMASALHCPLQGINQRSVLVRWAGLMNGSRIAA